MGANTFGRLFSVTTFGESHGPAIGCVVDGCPPGLELTESDIQRDLDRRRPGTSRHVTQRQETDTVEILSGVFEGKTTGTPIGLLIRKDGPVLTIGVHRHHDLGAERHRAQTGAHRFGAVGERDRAQVGGRPGLVQSDAEPGEQAV